MHRDAAHVRAGPVVPVLAGRDAPPGADRDRRTAVLLIVLGLPFLRIEFTGVDASVLPQRALRARGRRRARHRVPARAAPRRSTSSPRTERRRPPCGRTRGGSGGCPASRRCRPPAAGRRRLADRRRDRRAAACPTRRSSSCDDVRAARRAVPGRRSAARPPRSSTSRRRCGASLPLALAMLVHDDARDPVRDDRLGRAPGEGAADEPADAQRRLRPARADLPGRPARGPARLPERRARWSRPSRSCCSRSRSGSRPTTACSCSRASRRRATAALGEREAVAIGLERTGRIVTYAALLFCIAIGAFATSQVVFIKELGVGTALAVLIDAFIVRALLVPSLMALLGPLELVGAAAAGAPARAAPAGRGVMPARLPRARLERRRPAREPPGRGRGPVGARRASCSRPPRSTRPSRSARCSTSPTSTTRACGSRRRSSRRRCSTPARRSSARSGREPGGVRHGPRPIDVDVLLLEGVEHESERLRLPHREVHDAAVRARAAARARSRPRGPGRRPRGRRAGGARARARTCAGPGRRWTSAREWRSLVVLRGARAARAPRDGRGRDLLRRRERARAAWSKADRRGGARRRRADEPGLDTIRLGRRTEAGPFADATGRPVRIVGAGRAATVLRARVDLGEDGLGAALAVRGPAAALALRGAGDGLRVDGDVAPARRRRPALVGGHRAR